jgi:phosphate uptake regulator
METRKVYVSGGSTYVISLPKKWVTKNGIKSGDSLVVTDQKGSLLIEPGINETEPLMQKIRISNFKNRRSLENFIIALYLAGYNTIRINLDKPDNLGYRQTIRHVMAHLIGVEIVEDTDKTMILEIIVDHNRTPTTQLLKRMYVINRSMLTDFIKVLQQQDIALAEDIIMREREIDRLHFLIVRQLKSAVKYSQVSERLGITQQQDCLGYRVIVKALERISDHVEKISQNYIELIKQKGTIDPVLIQSVDEIIRIFDLSVTSALSKNREKAEDVFQEHEKIRKSKEKTLLKESSNIQHALIQQSIFDSLQRIAEYTEDIAELTINMSVENT